MRMLPYADFVISTIDATFIPKEKKTSRKKNNNAIYKHD